MAELPLNWIEKPFRLLIKDVIGGDWGSEQPTSKNTECVAVIRGTDYKNWDTCRAKYSAIRYIKISSLSKRNLSIGDIVLEVSGGGPTQPVARTIIIDNYAKESNDYSLVCSNFFRKISIVDQVSSFYVNYYCKYAYKRGDFNSYQTQTTNLRNLNFNDFVNNVYISLAPLNEQKRIVKKLDAIIPKVDEINSRLERIPTILKRARQSILNQAITGELTKEWRKEHPNINNAKTMVNNLRRTLLNDTTKNLDQTKLNKIYDYQEEYFSYEIPDTWCFSTLEKLCKSFKYGTSSKSNTSGLIPVLRMGNLQNGKIDWNDLVYTSDQQEIQKYNLNKNDVLFNRTNSPELVGKTAIYRGEQQAIYAGYLIKIENYSQLNSEYLNYALNSTFAKEWKLEVKTDGVSQSNINAQKLAKFEISLPPIEEQEEIVRQVKTLFEKLDKIEESYTKAKKYADKITQSVLHKAFTGNLVTQDPNDKPLEMV